MRTAAVHQYPQGSILAAPRVTQVRFHIPGGGGNEAFHIQMDSGGGGGGEGVGSRYMS
jgi:hypothetical protein